MTARPRKRAKPTRERAEIARTLVLSTVHIPLYHIDGTNPPTATHPTEYGALMWVGTSRSFDDNDRGDYDADRAVAVLAVRKYARARRCVYILFDRDGPIMSGLPDHSDTYQTRIP